MSYDSRGSGFLNGGGIRQPPRRRNVARKRRLRHFPDVHITDSQAVKLVPDFDPTLEFDYTQRELHLLAEKMLLEDPKPLQEHPAVLSAYRLRQRQRREIYVENGTPLPHVAQGLYWRTHPQGRKWRSVEERRETESGFYR